METVAAYATALREIFVVEDLPAWNPNLRSKTAIRTSDTRYFVDPSIAAAALGARPNDLIADLRTFGFVFETLCMRDLRVYADAMGGSVYHYRDKKAHELLKKALSAQKLVIKEETKVPDGFEVVASEKVNFLSTNWPAKVQVNAAAVGEDVVLTFSLGSTLTSLTQMNANSKKVELLVENFQALAGAV